MKLTETYEQLGDPDDESYELTKKDHRKQQQAIDRRAWVKKAFEGHWHSKVTEDGTRVEFCHDHEDAEPGHTHPGKLLYPKRADGGWMEPETGPSRDKAHGPPREAIASIRAMLRHSAEHTAKHPEELVVWRLRLYCGHVIETTAHHTCRTPPSRVGNEACPECGLNPSAVIAAKALHRQDPLPGTPKPKPRPKQPTLAEQNAALRREVAELRQQLEAKE